MSSDQKLLSEAADEIVRLRKQVREMGIKLEMFDKMMWLAQASGPREGGMMGPGEDIVGSIDSHLRENVDQLSQAVKNAMILRGGGR